MPIIPPYVIEMARRKPPRDCAVIEGSTPVISFGNFRESRIATLGINPSNLEFLDRTGNFLSETEQRLATWESLGIVGTEEITEPHAIAIVNASDSYFEVNPYRSWFDYLEKVLQPGFGSSYYNGSACHLDLVQWSTKDKWSSLSKTQRQILLDEGVPFLRSQLHSENISHVIVNGNAVWNEIKRSKIAEFHDVETITFGKNSTPCTMRIGFGENTKFLGWTTNIQSGRGSNSKEFLDRLGLWLANNK